jgi:hypothetical protein
MQEQTQSPLRGQEPFFWQKLEIDGPFEKELPIQLKSFIACSKFRNRFFRRISSTQRSHHSSAQHQNSGLSQDAKDAKTTKEVGDFAIKQDGLMRSLRLLEMPRKARVCQHQEKMERRVSALEQKDQLDSWGSMLCAIVSVVEVRRLQGKSHGVEKVISEEV